jgi:HK97 family phage prohead protease
MQTKLKLDNLLRVLPSGTREALLATEGFSFDEEHYVKRVSLTADQATINAERAVEGYVSTRDVDRDNEVLDPGGVVLDAYKQNPVVLWAHDYMQPPIAKAEWIRADEYGVKSRRVYAETERGEEVWQLIKGGFLRTTSVGFLPIKRVWKGDPEWGAAVERLNTKWGVDLEKSGAQVITTKWAMLEYSDVPVPANPYALNTAVGKGLVISDELKAALGVESAEESEPVEEPALETPPETPEVELVVNGPVVARYMPPAAPPAPAPTPPDPARVAVVRTVKAARPLIVSPITPVTTREYDIAGMARETLAQLHGRV